MTVKQVISKFLVDKILVREQGKIVLALGYYPDQKQDSDTQAFEVLLKAYAELWPKGIKSGNRLIRRSVNSLRVKLKSFLRGRKDISHQVIIDATKYYLKGAKQNGWQYTISADYFISKFGSSELEANCDLVMEGNAKVAGDDNYVTSLN